MIVPKLLNHKTPDNKVIWRERDSDQIDKYYKLCNLKLKELLLPNVLNKCETNLCSIETHKYLIDIMCHDIVGILTETSEHSFNMSIMLINIKKYLEQIRLCGAPGGSDLL